MTIHLIGAVLAQQGPTFDPGTSVSRFRAILILILACALIVVSIIAVFGAGRRGNNAKAASITSASVIALIPAVIGVMGALVVGAAVFGWAVPGLSSAP